MPCTNIFDAQPLSYRQSILADDVKNIIAIETAHEDYWHKYVGKSGKIIGMNTFGESAPGNELLKHFGFTVEHIVNQAMILLK